MRCLFCKTDASNSRSREHIVPESLGNEHHVLPPGVVCDGCNNYFARKVEAPFLESGTVLATRHTQLIVNKRGLVPPLDVFVSPGVRGRLAHEQQPGSPYTKILDLPPEAVRHILRTGNGTLRLPAHPAPPTDEVVSRFLAKVALEAIAERVLRRFDTTDSVVDDPVFDPLRLHARRRTPSSWSFVVRRVYDADHRFIDADGSTYQCLFEYDLLMTDARELYFVMVLFGLEFAINVGDPSVDGYGAWLTKHGGRSPLYDANWSRL